MAWARLWFSIDRRFLIAAAGAASAIMLPVAATLVLAGLEPQVDDEVGWLLVHPDGSPVDVSNEGLRRAVTYGELDGFSVAAITHGDPLVEPGEAGSPNGTDQVLGGRPFQGRAIGDEPLIGDRILLHPADFRGLPEAAWYDGPFPGAVPARGADAFEYGGIEDLRDSFWLLIVASLPATVLVAAAFADQEVRQRVRTAATFAALGRPDVGRNILIVRVAAVAAVGAALATIVGASLWTFGGPTFHPADTPKVALAASILLPGLAAILAGAGVVLWRLRDINQHLQSADDGDAPGPHLKLPVEMRPLTLGTRLLPVIVLAAMLFVVDLGFPLAAAQIPAAIAGQGDEWVEGADDGLSFASHVDAAPGASLRFHPDVDDAVAEIFLPTTLNGKPLLARGGTWNDMARYHGLDLLEGTADGWALGEKAARRLGVDVGDQVVVQSVGSIAPTWVTVTGIYRGAWPMADEAVVPMADARGLANVAPDDASVVRVRPATPAALAVLDGVGGSVEVTGVAVGDSGIAGIAEVVVHMANPGSTSAERALTLRVNGEPAISENVALRPYQVLERMYRVPAFGDFRVDVNPTASGSSPAPARTLEAAKLQFTTETLVTTLRADGDVAGIEVALYPTLEQAIDQRGRITAAKTNAGGVARLAAPAAGNYVLAVHEPFASAPVQVADGADRFRANIVVDHAWIEGPPVVGAVVALHARVANGGGVAGDADIEFFLGEARFHIASVQLDSGESTLIQAAWIFQEGVLTIGEKSLSVRAVAAAQPAAASAPVQAENVRSAESIQAEVADRVLGDAKKALMGMAIIAMASSLSIIYLSTDRTLRGRAQVLATLNAMGEDTAAIRRRAGWEAAILGALGFLAAVGIGILLFAFFGWIGWPAPFAHSLPNPFGWVFVAQMMAAFGAACALAAFLATGPLLKVTHK